jgi:DNA-directed RNA polymerase specialized sigma24 family protein
MPYKDPDKQREYQCRWIAKRREGFFSSKVCHTCGAKEALELHHPCPETKVSHNIWSWSTARREAEIAKCVVLCETCHAAESAGQARERQCHLSPAQRQEVRLLRRQGWRVKDLAQRFGVSCDVIYWTCRSLAPLPRLRLAA